MEIKVIYSEEGHRKDNFHDIAMAVYIYLFGLYDYLEKVEKHCETQKEKACNKGVRQQRRNKAVNVSKSS